MFQELAVGTKFEMNGKTYEKINTVKITCCRSANCQNIVNTKERTFVQPKTVVEVPN